MFTRHISRQLAAHLDGRLTPTRAQRAELHLRECSRCRTELEQVRRGMAMVEYLPAVEAPEAIWASLEEALDRGQARRTTKFAWPRWGLAAAVVLVLAGAAYWRFAPSGTRWEVVRLNGAPSVDAKPLRGAGQIGAGEWIETDGNSRA